ncbi:hypothetical protein jhhlp_003172 [Lomentospora prolificans]|uniref:Mediator of RNA polymerase II transcription subunit 13 n=1 Tax=Lomentospora prolificans TaxID=41688 RepID=A0A2N3NG40_9PEZI|nr:hypothetical protein jhhlp_003172 [Lomentospora prolificans]
MEAGEYTTNTLVINNITSIAYRTYELSATDQYQSQPNPTVIQDVESLFRTQGCIAHFDTSRRIIWHFGVTTRENATSSFSTGPPLPDNLDIPGVTLSPVDDGSFEPMSLSRPRIPQQGSNTPTGGLPGTASLDTTHQHKSAASFSPASSSSWGVADQEAKSLSVSGIDLKAASLGAITVNDAYENFILALLGTILADFVQRTGALPLDNRTVLVTPSQQFGDVQDSISSAASATASFRLYLTPTGTLVINLGLHTGEGLLPLSKPQLPLFSLPFTETPIFVAPFGLRALSQGVSDIGLSHSDTGVAQTPDTQISRFQDTRTSRWRQICSRLLQLKGIPAQVLDSCPWVTIRVPRQKLYDQRVDGMPHSIITTSTAIAWPACLCFRRCNASMPPMSRLGGNMLVGRDESYDPLERARSWFQEAPERSETIAKRKKERETVVSKEPADVDSRTRQQVNGSSPLAFQRAANVAALAAGVMYPTPPDAIQNPSAPTPSLDGAAVASPNAQPPSLAVVDADVAMANAAPLSDTYPERDRNEAPYLGDSDALFGDLSGDMFPDGEVTDADFSFFDDHPGGSNVDVDVDMLTADLGNAEPQLPPPEPSQRSIADPLPVPPSLPTSTSEAGTSSQSETKGLTMKRESPVFAKPELRHARSVLGDDSKSASKAKNGSIVKREHSPFDPDTVFKRVRTALYRSNRPNSSQPTRRRSVYDKVEFDVLVPPVTSKYVNGGKYAFNWSPIKDNMKDKAPPTTDYLRRHGKNGKNLKALPENHGALIARITTGLESSSITASPAKLDGLADLDVDDMSTVSDQDDTSVSSEEPFSPVKSAGLRRANNEDDLISHATSLRDVELPDDSDPSFVLELPRLGRAGTAEMPVAKFFADPEPLALQLNLLDDDMIAIAQILTEQAALGTLEILSDNPLRKPPLPCPIRRRQLASLSRQVLHALRDSLPMCLSGASECQLRAFSEIQDGTPSLGPPSRPLLQPRQVPGRDPSTAVPPTVYQIPPPHLEVKRAETRLSVLPSAALFWESLGLGPSMGPKNVCAACVFPGWDGMADNISAFLERMKSVYESMKLGSFERLESTESIADGLVRYDVDKISMTPGTVFPRISSALAERIDLLCQALRGTTVSSKNLVIFFVYSPANPSSIVEACTSFHQLSEAYKSGLSGKSQASSNEVILQLVPSDFVCATSSVVIQPQVDLLKLCLETYDRCTLFNGPTPAPAILLEQVAPRFIDFSLAATPSASVMHENSCIHVAYARSTNGRWVTATWTDSRGSQQMMASYCLGRKGRPLATPFTDVALEIWETTHDLMSTWKVHWRIVITKCGPMDADEMEFWTGLAQTESKARVSLVLMTVDTSPSLQLLPPAIRLNPSMSVSFYTTPASTPQASILSPEQSGNPATPANAPTPSDANATDGTSADGILVDVMDQSWGCVLGHRLNNSTSPTEINPALFSGYLIKRGGTKAEDPPVVMEVNVIYSDGSPRQHEGLLREMLGHFRALGTLARVRGVTDKETDVRPWHVAAAEKGVRALYLLM